MPTLERLDLLTLADGASRTLPVVRWELGEAAPLDLPFPRATPLRVLRLFLSPGFQPPQPAYVDVTSQTLIEQMLPALRRRDVWPLLFTVTALGEGVARRYQLRQSPS